MNPVRIVKPIEKPHIVFLNRLRFEAEDFATKIKNPRKDDEYRGEAYKFCHGYLNLSRFALIQNLRKRKDYNPDEMIPPLVEAIKKLVPNNLSPTREYDFCNFSISCKDFILAIHLMASFDTIGTERAFQALYDCLINEKIDLHTRLHTINTLAMFARIESFRAIEKAQPLLVKEIDSTIHNKCYTERLIDEIDKAVEFMRQKEIW